MVGSTSIICVNPRRGRTRERARGAAAASPPPSSQRPLSRDSLVEHREPPRAAVVGRDLGAWINAGHQLESQVIKSLRQDHIDLLTCLVEQFFKSHTLSSTLATSPEFASSICQAVSCTRGVINTIGSSRSGSAEWSIWRFDGRAPASHGRGSGQAGQSDHRSAGPRSTSGSRSRSVAWARTGLIVWIVGPAIFVLVVAIIAIGLYARSITLGVHWSGGPSPSPIADHRLSGRSSPAVDAYWIFVLGQQPPNV